MYFFLLAIFEQRLGLVLRPGLLFRLCGHFRLTLLYIFAKKRFGSFSGLSGLFWLRGLFGPNVFFELDGFLGLGRLLGFSRLLGLRGLLGFGRL